MSDQFAPAAAESGLSESFEGKPVFAIVVEVHLSRDDEKRASWPVYLTSLRARLACPTVLLVVAPNRAVARWCGNVKARKSRATR